MADQLNSIESGAAAAPKPALGLTPYLQIGDAGAAAAIDFYKKAFAAEEVTRQAGQEGPKLMHVHLRINGSQLFFSDSFPEFGHPAVPPAGMTLHLQVDDADRWYQRAVDAGCIVTTPIATVFWGDRYGQVRDPFGFTWGIGSAPAG